MLSTHRYGRIRRQICAARSSIPARGLSMIEVLVAMLVLAVGLLGVASLQARGLHNNLSSQLRTQATIAAHDIVDRMRANPDGYENGDYNKSSGADAAGATNANCETTAGCTSSDMALNDLQVWADELKNRLPDGQGVVCQDKTPNDGAPPSKSGGTKCSGAGNDPYAVKVWWRDKRDGSYKRFATAVKPGY